MQNLKIETFLEGMVDKAKESMPEGVAYAIVVWEYDVPGLRYQSTAPTAAMLHALQAVTEGHTNGSAQQVPWPKRGPVR